MLRMITLHRPLWFHIPPLSFYPFFLIDCIHRVPSQTSLLSLFYISQLFPSHRASLSLLQPLVQTLYLFQNAILLCFFPPPKHVNGPQHIFPFSANLSFPVVPPLLSSCRSSVPHFLTLRTQTKEVCSTKGGLPPLFLVDPCTSPFSLSSFGFLCSVVTYVLGT